MNWEDSEQLKQFEWRLERRLELEERLHLRYNSSKPELRVLLYATWYVLLAAAVVSTIYHLLVI